jgi:hypothetical protein
MTTSNAAKHPAIALLAAPFLGLAFLVFLPFIGFALTLRAGFHAAAQLAHHQPVAASARS